MDTGKIKKAYFYLHSYELLLILTALCFITHFNYLLSFTTLGLVIHVFCDQLYNPVHSRTYFLTYRMLNGYKPEIIFRPTLYKQKVRKKA